MKIGVLGGTFNPPHAGHCHAAKTAADGLGLDRVLFVPTNTPPHKAVPENSATPGQRLEMAAIAAASIGADVCDIEFRRGGKSYTADTLDMLREEYPNDELWLIMGTDMFLTVQNWFAPERIFAAARIAVVARDEQGDEVLEEHRRKLIEEFGARIDIVKGDVVEVSSTRIRNGEEVGEEYLCPAVREYIRKNRLYQKDGDVSEF